ncbi:MAG TPA: DNA-binding protein [Burkholderiaceae bacterium]|jgi:chromosome segregation ATPase
MARPGVSKSEVLKARNALLASGKHPSIDSIRIQLGNTGSKATIFRLLKEIEADEGGVAPSQASVSEELQAFVTNLASRLEYESQERFEILKAGQVEEVRKLNDALETSRTEARGHRLEAERSQVALTQSNATNQQLNEELERGRIERAQLTTQLGALQDQLKVAQEHSASLEQKHEHAREALEHFRAAAKEQRDREGRQHEQQVHFLQKELAQANEALTVKQVEVRTAVQEKVDALTMLSVARAEKRNADEQLRELRPVIERFGAQSQVVEELRSQLSQSLQQTESAGSRAAALESQINELEMQLAAEHAAASTREEITRDLLSRIGAPASKASKRGRSTEVNDG